MNTKRRVKASDVYCFWTYDQYPYVLSGVADLSRYTGAKEGEWYYIPSYSGFVRPFFTLKGRAGAALAKELKALELRRREDQAALSERYRRRLVRTLKKVGAEHPNPFVMLPKEQASAEFDRRRKAKAEVPA